MNRRAARALLFCIVCVAALTTPAHAQRLALETLADAELWKTDAGSRLLARNDGSAFATGRLHVFAVLRATSKLELRAIGVGIVSSGHEPEAKAGLEMLAVRFFPARAFVLEAGRILMPIGSFGLRRFSSANPLIGEPDLYPVLYPWGAAVSGGVGRIDYRAAVVSLPAVNPSYSPAPGQRARLAGGIGFTAGPSFRIGAAVTHGSYLGPGQAATMPVGTLWQDYHQTVLALDVHFSTGYLDTRAELAWSSYDVPTINTPVRGLGSYVEARFTHTPRIFTALRLERNDYPFVRPVSTTRWIGRPTTELNGEAGVGYRMSQAALLKVTYRRDYWPGGIVPGATAAPDGYALGVQFSIMANVMDLFARPY